MNVIAEQDFGRSGRVKKETAPAVGEIEGAQPLIRGAVTTFEPECFGGTLAVIGVKQACVSVNMRIIDAKTGRVLNATTIDGSAMTAGVGLTANVSSMPLPLDLGGWSKTPMEGRSATASTRRCSTSSRRNCEFCPKAVPGGVI